MKHLQTSLFLGAFCGLGESSLCHAADCRLSSGSQLKTHVSSPVAVRPRKSASLRDLHWNNRDSCTLAAICSCKTSAWNPLCKHYLPLRILMHGTLRHRRYLPILQKSTACLAAVLLQFLHCFQALIRTLGDLLCLRLPALHVHLPICAAHFISACVDGARSSNAVVRVWWISGGILPSGTKSALEKELRMGNESVADIIKWKMWLKLNLECSKILFAMRFYHKDYCK